MAKKPLHGRSGSKKTAPKSPKAAPASPKSTKTSKSPASARSPGRKAARPAARAPRGKAATTKGTRIRSVAAVPAGAGEAERLESAIGAALGIGGEVVRLRALRAFAAAMGVQVPAEAPPAAAPAPARAPKAAKAAAAAEPAAGPPKTAPSRPSDGNGPEGPPLAPSMRIYVHGAGRPPIEMIEDAYVIGSSPKCDLWVNGPQIETRHLQITREGSRYFAQDLGSEHGTFFGDGTLMTERHELADKDELFLAKYHRIRFYLIENK